MDGEGRSIPLSLASKKLSRVCRSFLEAETMAMLDTVDTSMCLLSILHELVPDESIGTTAVYTYIMCPVQTAHSTKAAEENRLGVMLLPREKV